MGPAENSERCVSESEALHQLGESSYTRFDGFLSALESAVTPDNDTAIDLNSHRPLKMTASIFMLPMELKSGG